MSGHPVKSNSESFFGTPGKIKRVQNRFTRTCIGILLKSANISQEKEQLARATLTELTYAGMKKQLEKIFDETGVGSSNTIQSGNIKIEPVFQASCIDDEEDVLYGESYRNQGHRNFQGRGCTNYCGRNQRSFRATNNEVNQKQKLVRNKNPPDAYGYPSKCMICKSIYYWANNCPERHLPETSTQNKADNITLFTESVQSCYIENFLGETLSNAVLDSGCTQCVGSHGFNATKILCVNLTETL